MEGGKDGRRPVSAAGGNLMDTVKILGGGIAGLTAAINLKKAGFPVRVHERKSFCGKSTGDFQFLENWTFDGDVLELLQQMNIAVDFYVKPRFAQEIRGPGRQKYVGRSSRPLMYLVKRGPVPDSIDQALCRQAQALGVEIVYRARRQPDRVHIVATGRKKPTFLALGVRFDLDHPDHAVVLLDDRLSDKFYSYLVVNDGRAVIVCVNPAGTRGRRQRLERTVQAFEQMLGISVPRQVEKFAAAGCFYYMPAAGKKNRIFVGEAAGFQDCLAGFGMLYAVKSGYHAACSLIENRDYDRRWRRDMEAPMRVSIRNRRLYEQLGNDGYVRLIEALNSKNPLVRLLRGGNDLRRILKRAYNHSFPRLLHPFLLQRLKA